MTIHAVGVEIYVSDTKIRGVEKGGFSADNLIAASHAARDGTIAKRIVSEAVGSETEAAREERLNGGPNR